MNAKTDRDTYDSYLEIAKRMHSLLRPGGVAVVTDACRFGFFGIAKSLGLPKRYCFGRKTINYRIHQDAITWRKIFSEAGFAKIEMHYPVPYKIRSLAPVIDNPLANFFFLSSFIMRAWS